MANKKANGQVYNVGMGIGTSNKELAIMIVEREDLTRKTLFSVHILQVTQRPLISDQSSIIMDSTKVRKEVGWKPVATLAEGIDKVISYFTRNNVK